MTARVLFFGATADIVGTRALDFSVTEDLKAAEVLKQIVSRFPALAPHKLHLSINRRYAIGDETICDGDELALFTPVSGG